MSPPTSPINDPNKGKSESRGLIFQTPWPWELAAAFHRAIRKE